MTTCSVLTRILASANRFEESSLKWDSRFWERRRRAEISSGGKGWSGEVLNQSEELSFMAAAMACKIFFFLGIQTAKEQIKKNLLY